MKCDCRFIQGRFRLHILTSHSYCHLYVSCNVTFEPSKTCKYGNIYKKDTGQGGGKEINKNIKQVTSRLTLKLTKVCYSNKIILLNCYKICERGKHNNLRNKSSNKRSSEPKKKINFEFIIFST